MGHHRAGEPAAGEAHGRGALSGFIRVELDVIVLSDAAAVFLESTDALPDLVDAFLGSWFGEPLGELGECVLEAVGEAFDDAAFLVGALFGEAVQAYLPSIVGQLLVQLHAVLRGGLNAHRGGGVKVPGAFPADHQVAVALHATTGCDLRWRCRGPSPPGYHVGR